MNRLLGFKSNQLAEALRQKIVSGEYPQGSRLPTCRELASQYRVENGIRIPEDIAVVTQGLAPCIHTASPPLS